MFSFVLKETSGFKISWDIHATIYLFIFFYIYAFFFFFNKLKFNQDSFGQFKIFRFLCTRVGV